MNSVAVCVSAVLLAASDWDEFKVKREAVFEFAQKPTVTRQGDRVEIRFETKGFCDVAVALEEADGTVVRHLACGVLGPKAPEPFQKDSKKQVIVWDGKNDQGAYIDDKDSVSVRVSLGLRAAFERTLFWSPYKRYHQGAGRWGFVGTQGGLPTPRIAAAPEGIYVFEGRGVDHLRLFDHDGWYVRTIYPPPAGKLDQIVGLAWYPFPQEGNPPTMDRKGVTGAVVGRGSPPRWFLGDREVLPLKHDILQTTFLTSGPSGMVEKVPSMFGNAATALAVHGTRMALVHRRLNRLATDGSSGGLPLEGPQTHFDVVLRLDGIPELHWLVSPASAAFSPDGKTLYCTGFMYRQGRHSIRIEKDCLHGVLKMDFEKNDPATVFVGSLKQNDFGTEEGRFRDATSVDCDAQGRVYVTDFSNDRIQVFAPDGKHLKNIAIRKPALVRVHRRTQELYVFSWMLDHWATVGRETDVLGKKPEAPAQLVILGPFEDQKPRATYALPLLDYSPQYSQKAWGGLEYTAELDSWTDPPRIWLVPGHPGAQDFTEQDRVTWAQAGIKVYALRDGGRLELLRDFGAEAARAVGRLEPPMWGRQRLVVNPKTGLLYVLEGQTTHYKAFREFLEIDPETGAVREVPAPFDAEDMTIDYQGSFYFKSHDLVARYDLTPALQYWREVPFDYGVQRKGVGTSASRDGRRTDVTCGIPLYNGTGWHKGGLDINLKGEMLTSSLVTKGDAVPDLPLRTDEAHVDIGALSKYVPLLYPGRLRMGEIHIWDPHGRLLHQDVVKGLVDLYGVGLDKDRNVYVMAAPTRILDGHRYFDPMSETVMKFKPDQGRVISENSHLIPVQVTTKPNRPHDLIKGTSPAWVEGAEWMYGGVGYGGKNAVEVEGHCACWNARFTLDYFGRSFAPELRRFQIAVLDTNGNLIQRIGHYGNVDDEGIALMHGAYVATQTDRRLFVADPGNARIVAATLGYHASETVPLRSVQAGAK
jgi:hypothetical protein